MNDPKGSNSSFVLTCLGKSVEERRSERQSQALNDPKGINSSFVLTCVGKSAEGLSEDQEYEIERFDEEYLDGLANLVSDDIDPTLIGIAETDPALLFAKEEIVATVKHYTSEYSRELSDKVSLNAPVFYRAYLSGKFRDNHKYVVVVHETSYKLWPYEETAEGEQATLQKVANEPSGVFAMSAKGYWMSNVVTIYGLAHENYKTSRAEIGMMMNGSYDQGFLVSLLILRPLM